VYCNTISPAAESTAFNLFAAGYKQIHASSG